MWQRSLQVTRVSAVAMPESKDSRTFPRLNRQAVEMGAAAPTQTAGVGAAEGTAVQCPVVTEYVIERYGYPFSQFKRVRVAASTSECFSRVKDGTFTPKFMVPADIKRAQNSPIWERGTFSAVSLSSSALLHNQTLKLSPVFFSLLCVVNLRHTSSGQPVTLFLDQVRDCTVMNQLLASSATPDNSEDDTAKFVAAFYPSFDARYYKTPVDEKGNMLVSKGDERERLAVNPLLHSSYNSDTGLFRPHPETKAERELERLDELRRMKAHADAHMPETFAGTGPLERRVNAGDNVDIHAAFRRARAHAAAARQGPQEAAPLAQSKPAAAQALPEGLGGSTSRSAAAGKGFTPRAKGNEPTDNQQQASAGTGATAAKG